MEFRKTRLAIWIGAGILLCAASCLFAVSTLSFHASRTLALSAIPPGYNNRFSPALFAKIVTGLRFLAAALSFCALLAIIFSERLSVILRRILNDLAQTAGDIWAAVHSLNNDPPLYIFSLSAVVIWGIALRLVFFGEPIRNDEAYSFMHYASRPVYVGLTYYTANNHILNTLLMHISTSVFGVSAWAVRLPTLIAGILIIVASYAAVRLFQGPNAALLAAAMVSTSSPLIEYSFNARGYGLGTLFFLIAIVMIGFQQRAKSEGTWLILPISAALALYSVPTMLYGVAGIFLYLLLRCSEIRRTLIAMIGTAVLTVILYSPALATVGLTAITDNRWVAPLQRDQWPRELAHEIASLWQYWNLDLPALVGILIAAGVILSLVLARTRRLVPIEILLSIAIVACGLMAIQSVVLPRRSCLFVLPLYFGAAAAGWSVLIRKIPFTRECSVVLSLILAGWMGATVLTKKSLRHSGPEAAGARSVEPIVLASRQELLQGAQFICADYFDSGLDFEMHVHHIAYRPSRTGELLIVTPAGASPQRTLRLARIPGSEVLSLHKIAHYANADEYAAKRSPKLPFTPRGTTEMGVFTEPGG